MSNWFCTICETINSDYNTESNLNIENKRCKLCSTYKYSNENQFNMRLVMNNSIDNLLPRHVLDLELDYNTIKQIGNTVFNINPLQRIYTYYPSDRIYEYVRNRLYYRSFYINKRWRRNICYKKFLKIILKYINFHKNKIEDYLILQYLLPAD